MKKPSKPLARLLGWSSIVSTIVAIYATVIGSYADHRARLLDESGTLTTGRIERVTVTGGGRPTSHVSYQFVDAHGASYRNEDLFPFEDLSSSLRSGDPISVIYLAEEPGYNNSEREIRSIMTLSRTQKMIRGSAFWVVATCFVLGYRASRRTS